MYALWSLDTYRVIRALIAAKFKGFSTAIILFFMGFKNFKGVTSAVQRSQQYMNKGVVFR